MLSIPGRDGLPDEGPVSPGVFSSSTRLGANPVVSELKYLKWAKVAKVWNWGIGIRDNERSTLNFQRPTFNILRILRLFAAKKGPR